MKVIFSQTLPFFLAHGGTQTFTERLMDELCGLGVEVEPERWWDEEQRGDILHFINRPAASVNVHLAKQKGYATIMTEFLDQPSSRPGLHLFAQHIMVKLGRAFAAGLTGRLAWDAYRELDAMVYAAPHEWETAKYLFNAEPSRGHVIPHGLDEAALDQLGKPDRENDYLVSVATIAPRKNTNLLARAARSARVPILFLGKAYCETDRYFNEFKGLIDDQYVRYQGFVSDEEKCEYLRKARGFALLSQFESGCIAVYEAAAAGLPLFLPDLPWARHGYPAGANIKFVPLRKPDVVGRALSTFYDSAHRSATKTFAVLSWRDVAHRYLDIYKRILSSAPANA